MKNLLLMRHSKSSWKNPDLNDFDRPLNKRGKSDAPMMGQRLCAINANPDLIITSPAKRAKRTATIIAVQVGFPNERIMENETIYMADVTELLSVIRNIDDAFNRVIFIGHNPDLTMLARILSNSQVDNIPTSGVISISFQIDSWQDVAQGNGKVVFFDYPKKISP